MFIHSRQHQQASAAGGSLDDVPTNNAPVENVYQPASMGIVQTQPVVFTCYAGSATFKADSTPARVRAQIQPWGFVEAGQIWQQLCWLLHGSLTAHHALLGDVCCLQGSQNG